MEIATLIVGAVLLVFGVIALGWAWRSYYVDLLGGFATILFSALALLIVISANIMMASAS